MLIDILFNEDYFDGFNFTILNTIISHEIIYK